MPIFCWWSRSRSTERALQRILATVNGDYVIAAASSTTATVTLHVPVGNPEGASLLRQPAPTGEQAAGAGGAD